MLRNSLLLVHILGAATWIGGGVMLLLLTARMAGAPLPVQAGAAAFAAKAGTVQAAAAGITFLAGVGLVLSVDAWDWEQAFVVIGIAVFLASSVIGARLLGPASERIAAAAEAGDATAAAAARGRLLRLGAADLVLLVLAVTAMVFKWGA